MTLVVNGVDVADLDMALLHGGEGGLWSGPRMEREISQAVGLVGVRPSVEVRGQPKTISLQMRLTGTPSARRAKLDRVLWHFDGLLVLEWSDAPGRYQLGRVVGSEIRARFAELAWLETGQLALEFEIVLDAPLSFDTHASVVAVSSTPTEVPLGTATSAPLFEFPQVTSAMTITYRGISGEVLAELSIADPNLTTGELLIVDVARARILTWDGSTYDADGNPDTESAMNLWTGGSFPVFDPGDGSPDAGAWPTIEASESGVCTYRRAWE